MRRDHDAAEQLYKQALRIDPNHVMTLCNYGALLHEYLHDIKGDLVDVEHMYQKALRLDANQLETLPREVGALLKLEVLTVRGNQLSHLPLEVGLLRRLKQLDTEENPILTPPAEVCKGGAYVCVYVYRSR